MATTRKNQNTLADTDWDALISAINQLHGVAATAPAYRAFVQVHADAMSPAGMSWGVHTMPSMGMVGRNFLAWHRRFLWQFEQRLQKVDASLALPYWDWIADPQPPPRLSDPALLTSWSVTRAFQPTEMPTANELATVLQRTTFSPFQRRLELGPHVDVHVAIGGTMNSASSPADPIFWLHHANIDRIWAQWSTDHPRARPSNRNEVLQPPPIFGAKVADMLDITALGYEYA